MKYIAYGSNMNVEQMAFRCPHAKIYGVGHIENYRLEFYLHATIDNKNGENVPVVVWEINDKKDWETLDIYEGYPNYYIKRKIKVRMDDGREIKGIAYIMNFFRDYPPTQEYVDGIVKGYTDFGFENEIYKINEAIERSKYAQNFVKNDYYYEY